MKRNGFTLVEMLVALFVFALIAAASAALLRSSVDSEEASREALDAVSAIRRMNIILDRDIGQAVARPHRDRTGAIQTAFFGNDGSRPLVFTLVRRGWTNYDDEPRSSLQKVEYRFVDGRIERRAFPRVDGADPAPPTTVIDDIGALAIRYLHEGEWRDRWDPSGPDLMPAAVEITFEHSPSGVIRQVFLVGGGA